MNASHALSGGYRVNAVEDCVIETTRGLTDITLTLYHDLGTAGP